MSTAPNAWSNDVFADAKNNVVSLRQQTPTNRRSDVKRGFGSAFSCKFAELYEKSLDYLPLPCYTIIVNQFADFVRRK